MIPLMMRKANAQRISNRFALSLDASCFCAELAAAVVLPVQAVLLRAAHPLGVTVVEDTYDPQQFYSPSAGHSCVVLPLVSSFAIMVLPTL